MKPPLRADREGAHRQAFARNRKKILASQNTCGICGQLVDKTLKRGDPMAPCIDHIKPISKGGHPSEMSNIQLAHWACNRDKSDKVYREIIQKPIVTGSRNLPQSMDWRKYRSDA